MGCLSYTQCQQLLHGVLPEFESEKLHAHAQRCLQCREHLHALSASVVATTDSGSDEEHGTESEEHLVPGYELIDTIAQSPERTTYKARRQDTGRTVLLTTLHERLIENDWDAAMNWAKSMVHENSAGVIDYGKRASFYYYATDFIDGMLLRDYLRHRNPSRTTILRLIGDVCMAVDHAHRNGLIHARLSPDNIVIDNLGCPKVVGLYPDVCLATMAVHNLAADYGKQLAYVAPEQLSAKGCRASVAVDVHALGVITYEALTARRPYDSDGPTEASTQSIINDTPSPPSHFVRRLPADVDAIVLKSLSKDPLDRYKHASDMADDIQRHLAGERISARSSSFLERVRGIAFKHKRIGVITVAMSAALVSYGHGLVIEAGTAQAENDRLNQANARLRDIIMSRVASADEPRSLIARFEQVKQGLGEHPTIQAELLFELGQAFLDSNDPQHAYEALELARQQHCTSADGRDLLSASIMTALGRALLEIGDSQAARDHLDQALAIARARRNLQKATDPALWNQLVALQDRMSSQRRAER